MPSRRLKRGMSELVIILALIAVAIPVIMVVQNWLSRSASGLDRVSAIPPLTGYTISRTRSGNTEILTIGIKNQGQTSFDVVEFKAILSDGSIRPATENAGKLGVTLNPGEERVFVVVVSNLSGTKVKSVVAVFREPSSGRVIEALINVE